MSIKVTAEKCVGCGMCAKACGYGAVSILNKKAVIDLDKCVYCSSCVSACKFGAIEINSERRTFDKDSADYKGIWVYAELRNGKIPGFVFELLSKARELASIVNEEVCCFVMGYNLSSISEELATKGADIVYAVDYPELKDYKDDAYSAVMAYAIEKYKPSVVLAGSTVIGRAFIPRVAVKLETGLTADCVTLEMDTETKLLLQTRPAFSGNLMATIVCENMKPQMATVRPGVFAYREDESFKTGEIINLDVPSELLLSNMEVLSFVKDEEDKINLKDYDIVVAGGRGMKNKKGFELIERLAEALGGVTAASRAASDSGWIAHNHLVGQTGTTVKPKLYFAIGISGAVQHLSGMEESEIIIAVNTDPSAPIFEIANYKIVADAFEFIPQLIEKLKVK